MKNRLFFFRGYLQALFLALLVLYAWLFPDSLRGTWLDPVADIAGIASLGLGTLIRIWAVSHPGKHTRSRKLKAPVLVTTGPYACLRNPIYLGNFPIGLGLVVFAEAIVWIPVYLIVFGWGYARIVRQEETFLRGKFGRDFDRYCQAVPRWQPRLQHIKETLSFGSSFFSRELGTIMGVFVGAFYFEWIDSPANHLWPLFVTGCLICSSKRILQESSATRLPNAYPVTAYSQRLESPQSTFPRSSKRY